MSERSGIRLTGLLVLIILVFLFFTSVYTIREGQQALLLRLGELVIDPHTQKPIIAGPGLHVKIPLINQVSVFDTRLQTLSVQASRILTEEQKYVLVDYYVKWRIQDLALYYTRTGGFELRAQTLLQQQINDALRAAFGQRTIGDVISERSDIMDKLRASTDNTAQRLGIAINDVRIKTIDLPKEVSESVFERMRADREKVATKHRSDGQAQAEALRADADRQVTITIAKAQQEAAETRAKGTSLAAHTFNEAYSKDPQFYALYRSLQAYKNTFNSKQDIVVLDPSSQFFKYFVAPAGGQKP